MLGQIGDVRAVLGQGLPPELAVIGPQQVRQAGPDFGLRVQLRERGGGIGRVEYRVNGVRVTPARPRLADIQGPEGANTLGQDFTLVPGRNVIETTVFNQRGTIASPPATVVVEVQAHEVEKPALHVLAIGVDRYRDRACG